MLVLGEPTCGIVFIHSGTLLACYGLDSTHIWNITDGTLTAKVPNPLRKIWESDDRKGIVQVRDSKRYHRVVALQFAPQERFITIATNSKGLYQLAIDKAQHEWAECLPSLVKEDPEDAWHSRPSFDFLNAACTQLAVAYSDYPLEAWALDPLRLIVKCRYLPKKGQAINETWNVVTRSVLHPFSGRVLRIYKNGEVLKWDLMNDGYMEYEPDDIASRIECS